MEELNEVLRKIPKNKAGGSDHWKPQELLVLPRVLKEALLKWIHRAEREGAWPEGFNVAHIALIDKPGATHEGQLRPICLLPYVYRAWMRMRKNTLDHG